MAIYRKYYTLRRGEALNPEIYPKEFDSYEKAFEKMVDLYRQAELMYKIYQTTEFNGNACTQQA